MRVAHSSAAGKLAKGPLAHKLKILDKIAEIIIMRDINGINFARNQVTVNTSRGVSGC